MNFQWRKTFASGKLAIFFRMFRTETDLVK